MSTQDALNAKFSDGGTPLPPAISGLSIPEEISYSTNGRTTPTLPLACISAILEK